MIRTRSVSKSQIHRQCGQLNRRTTYFHPIGNYHFVKTTESQLSTFFAGDLASLVGSSSVSANLRETSKYALFFSGKRA